MPPPPPGPLKESPYRPENPLVKLPGQETLSRDAARLTAAPFAAEVFDWVVPPKRRAALPRDAAVVLAVRDGSGVVRVAGKESALQTGSTLGISEGDNGEIENTSAAPLVLRIYVVRGQ